jgi:mannose-1-phosphate guanylyltransferase
VGTVLVALPKQAGASLAGLFDVQFAYSLLHPNVFDRVPNFVPETDLLGHRFNENKGRRNISGIDLHVFNRKSALPKGLACFQVFYSIKLKRIGYFVENAVGYFQSFIGELVNFVFRLEETDERDEDRHDGWRKNVRTKVSGGFVVPENSEEKKKDTKAQATESEGAGIFHLRGGTAPERFFRHGAICSQALREHKPVITRAFVLAAGMGTRLRPLTDTLPKPLVPIFQKPLITFALDHLINAGVKSFVINTHRLPELFTAFFAGNTYAEHPLTLVHEPELLETGGGIKNAEPLLASEPFLTYSGDILTDLDLRPLIEEHLGRGNDVTLALRETGLGADIAFADGKVVDIANRLGIAGRYDFANIAVWSPTVFRRIPPGQKTSFIPVVTEWIKQNGRIGGVIMNDGKWFNVGSVRQYLDLHRTLAAEKWKPHYVRMPEWPLAVAKNARVHPTAHVLGCSVVGEKCCVDSEAELVDTILWSGAQIASRSVLENCIVRTHRSAAGTLHDAIV